MAADRLKYRNSTYFTISDGRPRAEFVPSLFAGVRGIRLVV
jgi:hypothetical protein